MKTLKLTFIILILVTGLMHLINLFFWILSLLFAYPLHSFIIILITLIIGIIAAEKVNIKN